MITYLVYISFNGLVKQALASFGRENYWPESGNIERISNARRLCSGLIRLGSLQINDRRYSLENFLGAGLRMAVKSKKTINRRLPPAERREQIIQAARRVFIRMGLNGARTRDIADEIGVTEATLYIYFKTKHELFQVAIVEPLQALIKLPKMKGSVFANALSDDEKRAICRAAIKDIVVSMTDVYPLLITAQFSDQESGIAIYNSDIYPILQEISKATSVGFKLRDKKYAEFVAISTFGLCFSLVMHHHYTKTDLNIEKAADRITGLLLDGIAA